MHIHNYKSFYLFRVRNSFLVGTVKQSNKYFKFSTCSKHVSTCLKPPFGPCLEGLKSSNDVKSTNFSLVLEENSRQFFC